MARHVMVTGGSRGIGAAIVRRLLSDGHRVSFTYRRDDMAARELTAGSLLALAVRADVADSGATEDVFAVAESRLGPVEQLVNNAGITGPLGSFGASRDSDLRAIFDVNVFGMAGYSRTAVERWTGRGHPGVIVNLSSVAASTGAPGEYVGYAASKAAVEAFTRGLGRELGPDGIRVVGVAPGTTDTGIHASAGDPHRQRRVAPRVPLRRVADPAEIATVVVWALADEASYLTATTIVVAGGL
jgi:NAD(P)-dependent dehydrogenase (short-subunit alcohol dehydrogenase family)